MADGRENFVHALMSGRARGVGPALLRRVLRAIEPAYAMAMATRNRLYDRGIFKSRHLPFPVISVGNITAGGTGKTPVVQWLAGAMRAAGRHPAILMRGYKSADGISDEQTMLDASLNGPEAWKIPVHINPDRHAGGREVLGLAVQASSPQSAGWKPTSQSAADLFILDDGFQHRRLARDFDIVLLDATNPFGYGHVHPRGLLREPLRGLRRAHAIVITRADQVGPEELSEIELEVRRYNPAAAIFRSRHVHGGLRSSDAPAHAAPDLTLDALAGRRFFAFAGIANPSSLERQLRSLPGQFCGCRWLADHHGYTADDLARIQEQARTAGADVLVVTEKDWAKLCRLPASVGRDCSDGRNPHPSPLPEYGDREQEQTRSLPIWRLDLSIEFEADQGQRLVTLIKGAAVLNAGCHAHASRNMA